MFEMRNRWLLIILNITIIVSFTKAAAFIDRCPGIGVQNIRREALRYELSFIFYYASWNNGSVEARKVYDEVADLLRNQHHYFAEVDCWHLACNCTKTHEIGTGLPNTWPTLMIGFARRIKIQYFGDWNKGDLMRFVNKLYKPLHRVKTRNETKALLDEADGVVLGIFPNAQIREYRAFVLAAIQFMEADPSFSFQFAVTFGAAPKEALKPPHKQSMYILLITETKVELFEEKRRWNNSLIVHWLHTEMKRSMGALSAYHSPATITIQSKKAPVLALFLSETHLYENFKGLLKGNRFQRMKKGKLVNPTVAYCRRLSRIRRPKNMCLKQYSNKCVNHQYFDVSFMKYYYDLNLLWERDWQRYVPQIPEADYYYFNVKTNRELTRLFNFNKCLHEALQLVSPQQKICIHKFLKKTSELMFLLELNHGRNQSLAISMMDRIKFRELLTKGGLFPNEKLPKANPVIIIFDPYTESVFLFRDEFSLINLEFFMRDFYRGELPRYLAMSDPDEPKPESDISDGDTALLEEFNRDMLLDAMEKQEYTAVLLFYSAHCSLSGLMSHALTQVAAFFKSSKDELRFIRINTQTNTLPWHLEMPRTPSLLVFPKGRYEDSRIFPRHLKPDFRNLSAFIIGQLEPVQQVKAIIDSCQHFSHVRHLLVNCLDFSRSLVTEHISHYLKLWQIYENQREEIFSQLKSFKKLGLEIQQSFRL